jgi:hypothetical protein
VGLPDGYNQSAPIEPHYIIYSADEIEKLVIMPNGGLNHFMLVICLGYKMPRYITDDGSKIDLAIEDNKLNDAIIAYLERCGVKEISWQEQ